MPNTLTLDTDSNTDELSPELWWQDALERLRSLPAESVDLLYFDPPYGVTQAGWDVPLDLHAMLPEVMRVTHRRSAVVVHSQGMFTADIMHAWKHQLGAKGQPLKKRFWRYNLVWKKTGAVRGFLNANRQPLRQHEDICVFFRDQPTYNPQFTYSDKPLNKRGKRTRTQRTDDVYGEFANTDVPPGTEYRRHPTSVIEIAPPKFAVFAVQKPVALCEWVIRTFTNEGDTVCDPTMGSGTALVAARNTGRLGIGGDNQIEQVELAAVRVEEETDTSPVLPQGITIDRERVLASMPNSKQYLNDATKGDVR